MSRRVLQIVGLPVAPVRQPECLDAAARVRLQRERVGVVGAEQQQAAARHEVDEPPEGQPNRIEVRIDVGVVELDVVDDGDVGQVLQELRGLVEERAVVLVPLDHELAAAADPVAALEVLGDAADEHARIGAAVRQQPAGQRRRGRLAVRAGDDDRARCPQEVVADGLGQRAVADLPIQHFLELGVAARDGIADDDEIEVGGDVLGAVALESRDALLQQEVAHRRVDVLVGSANVVAADA